MLHEHRRIEYAYPDSSGGWSGFRNEPVLSGERHGGRR